MAYKINVDAPDTSEPASNLAPLIVWDEPFGTVEAAEAEARLLLDRMGRPKGTVWCLIVDEDGNEMGRVE